MQKNKHSILCTRPLQEQLINKAADNNIEIDVATFIKTEAVNTPQLIQQIQAFALQKIVAVFTSMNAVEAVIIHLKAIPDWSIFCLGGITKELVYDFFGETNVAATAKNAAALADKILLSKTIKEIVFFCGDQRLDELPETLRYNNVAVNELVVYTTVQLPVFIEKNYDAVIFFSPSAVHSFFSMNTVPVNVVMFSIGKTTTAIIQTYCTNKVVTSEWPGKEQMIENVISYYK
ncbi:MAG: uroporphyrinogen-III synthase [Panacibacter sp.]